MKSFLDNQLRCRNSTLEVDEQPQNRGQKMLVSVVLQVGDYKATLQEFVDE